MNNFNEINVLIGDNTAAYGVNIASTLKTLGITAFTRCRNGEIIMRSIRRDTPDVVVIDLETPGMNAMKIMNTVRESSQNPPAFIIISEINNSYIERQAIENGASYCLSKPFEAETLGTIIKSVYSRPIPSECYDLEMIVTNTIQRFGVPAHIRGYHYLRTAIINNLQSGSPFDSVTKQVYPVVADVYSTTPTRVERAIRNAIQTAWERSSTIDTAAFYGYNFDTRPTNSEFIALISDILRLRLKNSSSRALQA